MILTNGGDGHINRVITPTIKNMDVHCCRDARPCVSTIMNDPTKQCLYVLPKPHDTFTEGWNLMPVLSSCQVDVLYIASQIQDEIEIIKLAAGNGVYWPEKSVQSLNILVPGEAYLIRVNAGCSVVFPNCD